MPVAVIYVCAAMLIAGAAPLPYGYYTLLRFVAFAVFAFGAFVAHQRHSKLLPWLYALAAVLFNPFIKIHLDKEVWVFADVAAALLLLATAKFIKDKP